MLTAMLLQRSAWAPTNKLVPVNELPAWKVHDARNHQGTKDDAVSTATDLDRLNADRGKIISEDIDRWCSYLPT